jgi:hypothetical protein
MNNLNLKAQSLAFFPGGKEATSFASPLTNAVVLANNNRAATQIIADYFSKTQVLAGKPVFTVLGNKVVVNVFYYIPVKNQALNNSTINSLGEVLSKLYKSPVELRLVRLHYPYLNSYILAQYIAMNTRKYNLKAITNSLFTCVQLSGPDSTPLLPAQILGLKVKISGRLTTQRSVPRQTVQTVQIGSFSSSAVAQAANKPGAALAEGVVEYAAYTSKNKKGAFTVKVWISQKAYPSFSI